MPTINEQPRGRIVLATMNIPKEHHSDRMTWWNANSLLWSAHIDADLQRAVLCKELALWATELISCVPSPVIVDLGCGEGSFLRSIHALRPSAALYGVDFCSAMLNEAVRRSEDTGIQYMLGDLEDRAFVPPARAHLVTSILAVDEMDQIDYVFENVAKMLLPGGVAMIVVMDPIGEMERNRDSLRGLVLENNYGPDRPILLVKTFPDDALEPAAPYSRIVRSIARYETAAAQAKLSAEPVQRLSRIVGLRSHRATLTFDLMVFRIL